MAARWIPILIAGGAGFVLAAWQWDARNRQARAALVAARADFPTEGRPGGYVSSDACRACHPAQYASWHRSFHRTMTQYATPEAVKARFDGVAPFTVPGGQITLEQRANDFWMIARASGTEAGEPREYRLGLITGSHHMQVFWAPDSATRRLRMMPFAFLLADRRWVPVNDTFLSDPGAPADTGSAAWNIQCLRCHVTAGQPGLRLDEGVFNSRAAELGVGCEACHGPGGEHVRRNSNPMHRYATALLQHGHDPTIVNPRRLPPRQSAETCGQCHGVSGIADVEKFLSDGVGFRPGGEPLDKYKPPLTPGNPAGAAHLAAMVKEEPHFVENRFWPDGIVRVIGREWSAMARTQCYQRGGMTCLSCHSMHDSDPDDQLSAQARAGGGDAACLSCHRQMAGNIPTHTHHAAGSPGSRCNNCHMPYTTYGLLKATRSHFIESPRVATTQATGRPNACNLCHLDRSLGWAGEQLTRWYGQTQVQMSADDRTIAATVTLALRGDAQQRALAAWAMGWAPAQQASGVDWQVRYLILALADPYAAVRYVAGRSLRTLPGFEDMEYDYVAVPGDLARSVRYLEARWQRVRRPPVDAAMRARVVMLSDGALDESVVAAQVAKRDNRSMSLRE